MNRALKFAAGFTLSVMLSTVVSAQTPGKTADPAVPLDDWKNAVIAGDRAMLSGFYSTNPAMEAATITGPIDAASESAFWIGLNARSINLDLVQRSSPQPGAQVVTFQAEIRRAKDIVYVTESQLWQQQSGEWRLVASKRTEPAHLKQLLNNDKNIYPADADAKAEIKEAEDRASKDHRRVLLVFGANWCYDCHVLDLAFQRPDFASAIAGYEIVHVDIGEDGKKNADLAQQYQVPIEKGVPALAVLDSDGKLIVSQKNGEFEKARALTPEALLEFLNKWKARSIE